MNDQVSSARVSSNFVSATWSELTTLHISIPVSLSKTAACLGISINFQPVFSESNSPPEALNFTVSRLWSSICAFHFQSVSEATIHILNFQAFFAFSANFQHMIQVPRLAPTFPRTDSTNLPPDPPLLPLDACWFSFPRSLPHVPCFAR